MIVGGACSLLYLHMWLTSSVILENLHEMKIRTTQYISSTTTHVAWSQGVCCAVGS